MTKPSVRTSASSTGVPLAYSYVRFSTPDQRKGDSERRQTKGAKDWCQRNEARLDESTTLHDLGKSAYTGKHRENPDRNALAAFLKMVEQGRVPRGSFLIVESLDRLTREHIQPALLLILNLLQSGVRIVQLIPVEAVYDDKSEAMQVMMMMMELSRGNSESRVKSERISAAWAEKRVAARSGVVQPVRKDNRVGGMKLLTHHLPAWMTERGGKIVLNAERAKAVKRIFQLAAQGHGLVTLIKQLNSEKLAAFGKSGRWTKAYVARILSERRAIGEYQPSDHRKPDGSPIANYYPAAVTESEFYAAQANRNKRLKTSTRIGKCLDLFAGLLRDARGGNYVATTRRTRILFNTTALDGRDIARTFPLAVFERGLLRELREVDAKDVVGETSDNSVSLLTAEAAGIETELVEAVAWMDAKGFSPAIAKRVTDLEGKKREVADKLAEARAVEANPASEAWSEFCSLADLLDKAKDKHDTRVRMRAAIRRVVAEVVVLVVPRGDGRDRFCVVEVHFKSGCVQSYLMWYRSASNRRESLWFSGSFLGDPINDRGWHRVSSLSVKDEWKTIDRSFAEMTVEDVEEDIVPEAEPMVD